MTASRVALVVTLSAAMLGAPLAPDAQPARKVPRIGVLWASSTPTTPHLLEALRQGLRERGYADGRDIAIESRWADGQYERLPDLAAELVRLPVDVIVAPTIQAALAAKQATGTIPIVTVVLTDPMKSGLVGSLARPGGNVTGLSQYAGTELVGKYLDLLKEAIPRISRVAILWNPANPGHPSLLKEAERAARSLGLRAHAVGARGPEELDGAFAAMTRERADALVVFPDSMFLAQRGWIAEQAVRSRLPGMFGLREYVEAGGLMAYAASLPDLFRRAATVVDKILRGAKPADLPMEQPTQFELVVNLKVAKALGLTIPQSILVRAGEVIQ
jgi:putative ABC transport system substrate-binding protein